MKIFKNKIAAFLLISAALPLFSQGSIPEISLKITGLNKITDSDYTLEYSVTYKGPPPEIFSAYSVYIPDEAHIIEGIAENFRISERDFLFSRLNVDLNSNGSLEDTYTISARGGDFFLNNTKLNLLYTKAGNREIFTSRTVSSQPGINRTDAAGRPFTLHRYNSTSGEIKIGLARENGDISFAELPNAQALIEIISDTEDLNSAGTSIDDARIFKGTTNEKIPEFAGDYHRPRLSGARHMPLKTGINTGAFTIRNPDKPALIRLTVYFALTGRMCIFDRRTILIQ